ncbi:uncharacterized protein rab11fip5a isoform X3 [Danio rerio]|uniref:Uncharacterized protein rab11fip5a isoform X3 n=1 Tax=Danio rerio TaxID=7955 RepID=A0AC58H4G5_DANRE
MLSIVCPLVSPQSDSSANTSSSIVPLNFNAPSQNMTDKNTATFTPPSPFYEANPILPLAQQNNIFQELHSDAPLTPDVPSLFSSQVDGNATPDLLRVGNKQGPSKMEISVDPLISPLEGQTENDDFEDFAKDRLKPLEEMAKTNSLVTLPALLIKTNNQEPLSALGCLMRSHTNYLTDLGGNALASTVDESTADTPQISRSNVNSVCSSSNKPDLTNHGAYGFAEYINVSEISLPENSSLEFSELNTFACPFPALPACSKNEDNADVSIFENPSKMAVTSQDAKSDVRQLSLSEEADALDLLPSICIGFSDGGPESLQRPEALKDVESVTIHEEDLVLSSKGNNSGDTLEQSTMTSDSVGGVPDQPCIEPCQTDIITGNIIKSDEEFWRSGGSLIQNIVKIGKSQAEATEASRNHVQSAQSFLVSTTLLVDKAEIKDAVMNTIIQNESREDLFKGVSHNYSEIKDSVPENLPNGISFPVLLKTMSNGMQENKESVSERPISPFKNHLTGTLLSSISEEPEIMYSNEQTLPVEHNHSTGAIKTGRNEDTADKNSLVLSPGSVLLHSLYKCADSDQYLTCVSQQDSISSNLELTQEVKTKHLLPAEDTSKIESFPSNILHDFATIKHDTSVKAITKVVAEQNQVIAEKIKPSQEALPKKECRQDVSQNNYLLDLLPETHTITPMSDPSHSCSSENTTSEFIKPEFDESMVQSVPSDNYDFPKDTSSIVVTSEMIAELEAQLAPLDTDTCLTDHCKTCPTKVGDFQRVQEDEFFNVGTTSNDIVLAESNPFMSDYVPEQTSSITQDLVKTDADLKNIFLSQATEIHLCNVNFKSAETHSGTELHPKPVESLDRNTDLWTTPVVQQSATPDLFSVNWPTLPQSSAPSPFDQPTLASRHSPNLNFISSLFDLSPVASSTPHVAVDTFPFPINPPTSAESLQHPELAGSHPTMQPVNSTSCNPFLQDKSDIFRHKSSPHPVKPLTPPDEKRSEGRSVLEKLKSTIHSGRSDADKKPLVEGGGSYYHLNHSELVNLLIQRDMELRQEREEYEKRGMLLEKRETDLKKMKLLIKDLEDYIDTLLVRIMEQTPTLLQVRPKMK